MEGYADEAVEYPEWSSQSDVPLPEFIDAIEPDIEGQEFGGEYTFMIIVFSHTVI